MSKASRSGARGRLAVCTLPADGSIVVSVGETTRRFIAGDVVDLEAEAVSATEDRPAVTWREALGDHVEAFAPAIEVAPAPPPPVVESRIE